MKFLKEKIKAALCLNTDCDEAIPYVMYFSGMLALTLFMMLKCIGM